MSYLPLVHMGTMWVHVLTYASEVALCNQLVVQHAPK